MSVKIKVSTDSTADIPKQFLEELDIPVLPLTIVSGSREWLDGVTITPQEFYKILEKADPLPTSAAVPPALYTDLFERVWEEGYADLIHIALNSKGSSTCQNGVLARQQFFENHPEAEGSFRIHLVDSLTYSMGYGMAVIQAARMARDGAEVPEILSFVQDWVDAVRPTFVPLDLKCVKKSGRVSAAAAFLGDAIGLKPIICFEDGEAKIIAKARGEKNAFREFLNICQAEIRPGSPICVIRGGNEDANLRFAEAVAQALPGHEAIPYDVGCIISINTGPNMVGLIYIRK